MEFQEKVKALFEIEGSEISALGTSVNPQELSAVTKIIEDCVGNIFVTGCGTSAMAARKIVHTLNVIGERTVYLNPSDAVHGELGAVHEGDVVIIVSKGGNTAELTKFVPNLIEKKSTIVAVTEDKDSTIAKAANQVLIVKVNKEIDKLNMLATTSTLAVISAFDVIAILLMDQENFSERSFLVNHPSGAVGERLKEDVGK
ncbi:SIS domain-containing protein [Lacticaseibacillus salsurivasis]|uniref:SIS domain-containing protein n=1 Tax=Lacticaseibacillus salsurivasis TaxID=3081441 RepID=UPI0030C669AD